MKKIDAVTIILVSMAFALPVVQGSSGEAQTVSGTVQVVGTRVKTEGAKSDKYVVVYLEKVGDQAYPPPPSEAALLDQRGLVFVPHVTAVQKGTTVHFLNSDTTEHNIFSVDTCCEFDLGIFGGGQKASYKFDVAGEGVMLCKLHPEMAAYIVVLDSPYFAVAEIDGGSQSASFRIENVPPGDYVLKTWSKRCESAEQEIAVAEGQAVEVSIDLQRKQRKTRKRK